SQSDALSVTDELAATDVVADCPAFGTQGARFLDPGWAERQRSQVAALTNQVYGNRANGSVKLDVPRNNFIDDYIFDKAQRAKPPVPIADLCTDEEFMRRASLDLAGRIPMADDVVAFVSNPSDTKRGDLIETLLASQGYIDRMTNFFGDLFENTFTAVGNG